MVGLLAENPTMPSKEALAGAVAAGSSSRTDTEGTVSSDNAPGDTEGTKAVQSRLDPCCRSSPSGLSGYRVSGPGGGPIVGIPEETSDERDTDDPKRTAGTKGASMLTVQIGDERPRGNESDP